MTLTLTPEQQEIFDRVVGIVTQNDELRHQFKTAMDELHKQPNWENFEYIVDSDELPAVNARVANAAIDAEIMKVDPNISDGSSLFYAIARAVCTNFQAS